MLQFKAIKPSTMKIDAFRLEFLTAIHEEEREAMKLFKSTVETWEHPVVFESIISLKNGPTMFVGTDDPIYKLVNEDTGIHGPRGEKYPIVSKTGKKLRFFDTYTAKTTPGVIGSVSGGDSGTLVNRDKVMHPGHVGRHFPKLVADQMRPKFKRRMEQAMKTARIKCGHAYNG